LPWRSTLPGVGGKRLYDSMEGCELARLLATGGETSLSFNCPAAMKPKTDQNRDRIAGESAANDGAAIKRGAEVAFTVPVEAGTNCRFCSKVL
jgi:hypothetical protein